jgi:acetoacetate decarboxylase
MMSPPLNAIQVKTTQKKAHLAADIALCCGKVVFAFCRQK